MLSRDEKGSTEDTEMRCQIRIPLGKRGFAETYCYEPLRDDGTCPVHGQQVYRVTTKELFKDNVLPLAYIASPYSHKDSKIREARYQQICEVTKRLALKGEYAVYSPIAHWHPIAIAVGLPTDAMFWKSQNEGIIGASSCVIVVKMDGWRESIGVEMEIRFANRNHIKVIYISPNESGEENQIEDTTDKRCQATYDGRRCGQPAGHYGNHTITVGAVIIRSWT